MSNVLLIPGFAGGELYNNDPIFGAGGKVWISPSGMVLGGWERLRLNPGGDGVQEGIFIALKPGGPLRDYYNAIADYLRARGLNPIDAIFDWRYRLRHSGDQVAQQIRDLTRAGPINIVAHSRGGLVAATALHLLQDAGEMDRVRNVVTLGTPFAGSYLVVPYFAGWQVWNRFAAAFLNTQINFRFPLNYHTSPREMMMSWPAAYELMPDPVYAATQGDPLAAQLYDQAPWAAAQVPINPARLTEARGLWDARRQIPAGVRWLGIVGRGFPTAGPVASVADLNDPASVPNDLDGDGVVPLWSAARPGGNLITLELTHQALCTDPLPLALAYGFLAS